MTSVRQAVPTRFDRKLLFVQRKIIVFLDNATYYPESIMDSLSQINIFFLPMNTRSRLQSLDAGIIQNFKVKYREGWLSMSTQVSMKTLPLHKSSRV